MVSLRRAKCSAVILLAISSLAGCAHVAPWLSAEPGEWSVGAPSRGRIVRATHLPDRGPGFESFRNEADGGYHYAVRRLVDALTFSALYVQRNAPGGVPLRLGDLSVATGGQVARHRSHRAGRDADVLFFALDEQEHPMVTQGFVRYDGQGVSRDPQIPQRFDTRRNWLFIEALVSSPDAGVIWIFCSNALRLHLLTWARAHHRPAQWIERAEQVLHQPGDSAPHDDHFHVRVACTPRERARGCSDGGPLGWWLERTWGKWESASADEDTLLASLADLPPAPVSTRTPTRRRRTHR